MSKYKIMGRNILIKPIAAQSSSIITIQNTSNFTRGKIVLVGNGYSGDSLEKYDTSCFHEGMVVIFNEKAGQNITLDNERYIIVDSTNIIAIEKEEK